MRSLWILALAACSHAAAPAPANVKPPSGCERVSDHLVSLMSASSVATDEELDPYRRVIATRCEQDLWTDKAQQCFLDTKSLDDGDRCRTLLTDSQQQALVRDGQAAVDQGASKPKAAAPAEESAPDTLSQPKPAPAPPTRGPATKANSDPCEGGE